MLKEQVSQAKQLLMEGDESRLESQKLKVNLQETEVQLNDCRQALMLTKQEKE